MLIHLLIVLVVLCLVAWLIDILPIPASRFPIKTIVYVILIIVAIVYLLGFLGVHVP